MPVLDPSALMRDRIDAIARFHERTGIARAELDVSGGIDSATMLGLLVRALGAGNVTAVYNSIHSSEDSLARARTSAEAFDVPLVVFDGTPVFEAMMKAAREGLAAAGYHLDAVDARCAADPTILGSIRSCLRAPIGRGLNRLTGGGVRHGTGNECEDRFLRFYQKGGDGEVDTNPIAMLSKGEVYQLARALGVPRRIIDATPSPDLHANGEGHTDEAELAEWSGGVAWTYSRVDADTGHYTVVGTIERMSRFLDAPGIEPWVFGDEPLAPLTAPARPFFPGVDDEAIAKIIASARRLERITRHKMNPNLPTLGSRATLVARGVLSNDLPDA